MLTDSLNIILSRRYPNVSYIEDWWNKAYTIYKEKYNIVYYDGPHEVYTGEGDIDEIYANTGPTVNISEILRILDDITCDL